MIQKNYSGKYTSIVLHDRYQIMESWLRSDVYYIWDDKFQDQIREKNGDILYFNSFREAKTYVDQGKRK